jgi:RNA polymerase sigma factor (sigma-70 family)
MNATRPTWIEQDKPLLQGTSALRTLFDVGTLAGLSDGQLLERFSQGGPAAEPAFALLVERHGPMVLHVARGVLGDRHEAEDVLQATFLVLARQAGSIRRGDAVASWLYGVSRRLSLRARRRLARQRALEERRRREIVRGEPASTPPREPWPELYEELDRLPASFRAAVVLCDLEGHSYEQAAARLRCPVGTLQSRLSRGREKLRRRLEGRGFGSALALLGTRPPALSPAVPSTIAKAAVAVVSGAATPGIVSASAVALAASEAKRGALGVLLAGCTTLLAAGLVVAGLAGFSGGEGPPATTLAWETSEPQPDPEPIYLRLLDVDGKPVAGADVVATSFEANCPPRRLKTDAEGYLPVTRDDAGLYPCFVAGRGESLAWAKIMDPDRVKATKDVPVVLALRPLSHRVEGSVVDQAGKPIAGVELAMEGYGEGANGDEIQVLVPAYRPGSLGVLPRAVSDAAGRFVLSLPDGTPAWLSIRHPQYIGANATAASDVGMLDRIVLEPGGTIAGRVVDATTGRPVPGVILGAQAIEYHEHMRSGGWAEGESDAQGRFAIHGLESSVYNLVFLSASGRPTATARAVEGLRVRVGESTAALVKIIEGRPLRGVVIDQATRKPLRGTQVGCYGPARPRTSAVVETRKTDAQGTFTLYVPPGEQYVYIMDGFGNSRLSKQTVDVPEEGEVGEVRLVKTSAPVSMVGVAKAAMPQEAFEPVKERVKLAPDAANEAPAAPTRTLTGHVRDARGQPVPAVHVNITRAVPGGVPAQPQPPKLVATDREGTFLLKDVRRVPLTLFVNKPGYISEQHSIPADRDEVEITYAMKPDASSRNLPPPRHDEPIPAALRPRLTFLELSESGNDFLGDGPGGVNNDLNRLPRGVSRLDGTYFQIGESMVHLRGQQNPESPLEIKGIKVRARGDRIHFLHGVQNVVNPGTEVGAYVVHYVDGSTARIPLVYGRDLANWWQFGAEVPDRPTAAKVAWSGLNDATEHNKRVRIRLFALAWANPHPEKEIASIDMTSAGTPCDPFLVAATVERDE